MDLCVLANAGALTIITASVFWSIDSLRCNLLQPSFLYWQAGGYIMHARLKLSLVLPRAYVWLSICRRPRTHTRTAVNWRQIKATVSSLKCFKWREQPWSICATTAVEVGRVQGPIFTCFQIRFLLWMSHLRLTSNTLQRSGLMWEIWPGEVLAVILS